MVVVVEVLVGVLVEEVAMGCSVVGGGGLAGQQ
jgi:hypothetical protein